MQVKKTIKKPSVIQNLSGPVRTLGMVGEGGFEPPKLKAADLQSVPFGHSGTLPLLWDKRRLSLFGAGNRTRTYDLLITNQLLYQLSYTSIIMSGRDDRIRTCGPLVPNQMRYQTALHPEILNSPSNRLIYSNRCYFFLQYENIVIICALSRFFFDFLFISLIFFLF